MIIIGTGGVWCGFTGGGSPPDQYAISFPPANAPVESNIGTASLGRPFPSTFCRVGPSTVPLELLYRVVAGGQQPHDAYVIPGMQRLGPRGTPRASWGVGADQSGKPAAMISATPGAPRRPGPGQAL
jgi:hypothetical protein